MASKMASTVKVFPVAPTPWTRRVEGLGTADYNIVSIRIERKMP